MTVTTSRKAVVTLPTDTQILITREFDSPKHLVYRAYTEPALVKRWWSEDRGEVTSVDADPRLGGKWRNVMRANDGSEVASTASTARSYRTSDSLLPMSTRAFLILSQQQRSSPSHSLSGRAGPS